jgi:hypothetical protein
MVAYRTRRENWPQAASKASASNSAADAAPPPPAAGAGGVAAGGATGGTVTVVLTDTLLSAVVASAVLLASWAVEVRVPAVVAVAVTPTVTVALDPMSPKVQMASAAVLVQLPLEGVRVVDVRPEASWNVSVGAAAVLGPTLRAVNV